MSMNGPNTPASQEYDYTSSGIDNFLNRSIDQVTWQTSLNAVLNYPGSESLTTLPGAPNSNQLNFNAVQMTGQAGTTQTVGSMQLNPSQDAMTLNDGTIQVNG